MKVENLGRGVFPYISCTGMCRPSGHGFSTIHSKTGSQIQGFLKFLYKQGLKLIHFDDEGNLT